MQPDNQPHQPQPGPYDFIMNDGLPQKGKRLGSNGSKKTRILVVSIISIVLLIGGSFVINLIKSVGQSKAKNFMLAAQQQTEIMRVSALISEGATDPAVKGYAETVQLTLTSQQKILLSQLKKAHINFNPKELLLGKDSKTDNELALAVQNSTYDSVSPIILNRILGEYKNTLKTTLSNISLKSQRFIIESDIKQVELLLGN